MMEPVSNGAKHRTASHSALRASGVTLLLQQLENIDDHDEDDRNWNPADAPHSTPMILIATEIAEIGLCLWQSPTHLLATSPLTAAGSHNDNAPSGDSNKTEHWNRDFSLKFTHFGSISRHHIKPYVMENQLQRYFGLISGITWWLKTSPPPWRSTSKVVSSKCEHHFASHNVTFQNHRFPSFLIFLWKYKHL